MFILSKWSGYYTHVSDELLEENFFSSGHEVVPAKEISRLSKARLQHKDMVLSSTLMSLMSFLKEKYGFWHEQATIIDAGVYVGSFSVAADICLKNLGSTARIYSFELNPNLHEVIEKNFKEYEAEAKLVRDGVSNFHGPVEMHVKKRGLIGSGLVKPLGIESEKVYVSVTTLKSHKALAQNSLIKLDLEGCEPKAFEGIYDEGECPSHPFIIEYSVSQANSIIYGLEYANYLDTFFDIYRIGNWMKKMNPNEIIKLDEESLRDSTICQSLGRQDNIDLVLIPKTWFAPAFPEIKIS